MGYILLVLYFILILLSTSGLICCRVLPCLWIAPFVSFLVYFWGWLYVTSLYKYLNKYKTYILAPASVNTTATCYPLIIVGSLLTSIARETTERIKGIFSRSVREQSCENFQCFATFLLSSPHIVGPIDAVHKVSGKWRAFLQKVLIRQRNKWVRKQKTSLCPLILSSLG
jgi:hypothetical protein